MARDQIRQSQLVLSFGPGAMLDLPRDSVKQGIVIHCSVCARRTASPRRTKTVTLSSRALFYPTHPFPDSLRAGRGSRHP